MPLVKNVWKLRWNRKSRNESEKWVKVVYAPVTGPRSWGIVHLQPAIKNKLAPKPTPKLNPNPSLALPLTLP